MKDKITIEIGSKIRSFRKLRGYTVQQLSDLINKSKATLSKYESGQIDIDIITMYDIAAALKIQVEQLLPLPTYKKYVPNDKIPAFFRDLSQFYIYMFDGRSRSLNRCVVDVLSQMTPDTFKIVMYLNSRDHEHYQNCEFSYFGTMKHYDSLTHLILQNQDSPIEQVIVTVMASFVNVDIKWGLFFGLSFRPLMPCAEKALLSRSPLKEDEKLLKQLMVSKEDIRLLKLYNMMTVT
ncbi:helix-turn-helix domain-containing protein [Sinanaerobacter chloroacetimidivorans]|uniref:Helix-turn-helix transcriptional regulator n=1 Tax=Sinanaerobacter chloroacetimidivorans TaxID=2818044 RepID=A0A8J8B031_9FIRM|nr:helix-turn-helix transcriptional regulator [Sinanaerobacter chloroacetimidivorans]MBR0596437.1 helix-turn-helix transcriptional regulator [Sinanaerobacter chloroacetimidivorans]